MEVTPQTYSKTNEITMKKKPQYITIPKGWYVVENSSRWLQIQQIPE